jgi:hypothetical protein
MVIMQRGCSQGLRYAAAALAIGSFIAPESADGSPARRLARRGVVVGPPAAIVVPTVPPPVPMPAPPWAWRRIGPPGVVVLPPFPGIVPAPPTVILGRASKPVPEQASRGSEAAASTAAAPSAAKPVDTTPPATSPQSAAAPQTPRVVPPANATASTAAQAPVPQPDAAGVVEEIPAPRPAPTMTADSRSDARAESRPDAGPVATAGASTAFTAAWYARHPDAWRPARMPSSPWTVADVATVTAWIGQPVVRADGATGTGQVAQASAQATAREAAAPDADGLRSVLVLPSGRGQDVATADEWLPLGVFAVAPPGGAAAHNYQQLAVDRSGVIRGTFYDAISDTVLPIAGAVDRSTLRATWTVGANGSRFEAAVAALAATPGTVAVTSGGATRDLELVPIDGP